MFLFCLEKTQLRQNKNQKYTNIISKEGNDFVSQWEAAKRSCVEAQTELARSPSLQPLTIRI